MHNPPIPPGEFIIQVYLDPNNLSGRELAGKLGVAPSNAESYSYWYEPYQP
jgi:plasmid maintenance system antidote protein VapI